MRPAQLVDKLAGALASSWAARQARIDPPWCCILATNELDAAPLPPQKLWEADKGQTHGERGCRCLKHPEFLAAALYLKKPARIMALLMVMTVGLLGYAAVEYRLRRALQGHEATFPNQQGNRGQNPTARWVLHYGVGMHLRSAPGPWPIVLNLTAEHRNLLRLLGKPYMAWYGVQYS